MYENCGLRNYVKEDRSYRRKQTIKLNLRNDRFSREGNTKVLVGKPLESPSLSCISSKFNPLNTDASSIQALSIYSLLIVCIKV